MSRIERVNQMIKEEIGQIIQREVKDPRLNFVTITHVEVTRDLQDAKVYFSILGGQAKVPGVKEGLDSARGFIRRLVGQRVKMRYVPEINFIFDRSLEYGIHIEEAIERMKDDLKSDTAND